MTCSSTCPCLCVKVVDRTYHAGNESVNFCNGLVCKYSFMFSLCMCFFSFLFLVTVSWQNHYRSQHSAEALHSGSGSASTCSEEDDEAKEFGEFKN